MLSVTVPVASAAITPAITIARDSRRVDTTASLRNVALADSTQVDLCLEPQSIAIEYLQATVFFSTSPLFKSMEEARVCGRRQISQIGFKRKKRGVL